jgi:hypothetical protein
VSLTGLPLLILSVIATVGALAATIFFWRRGAPRFQALTRTLCVLLCEALALFTGGLVMNRALDLYPSWSTLMHQNDGGKAPANAVVDSTTNLDTWLRSQAAEGSKNGLAFDWKPPEWTSWHLVTPPTIYLPPAYFSGDTLHFPVIIVAGPPKATAQQAGWDGKQVSKLVHAAAPEEASAIVIFLRVEHPDSGQLLGKLLPARLNEDLRVGPHGWAVVGIGADAPFGVAALAEQPGRYRSAAAIADVPGALPRTGFGTHKFLAAQPMLIVEGPGAPPAGLSASTDTGLQIQVVPQLSDRLAAALRWTFPLLPAPLGVALTGPVGPLPPPPSPKPKR